MVISRSKTIEIRHQTEFAKKSSYFNFKFIIYGVLLLEKMLFSFFKQNISTNWKFAQSLWLL